MCDLKFHWVRKIFRKQKMLWASAENTTRYILFIHMYESNWPIAQWLVKTWHAFKWKLTCAQYRDYKSIKIAHLFKSKFREDISRYLASKEIHACCISRRQGAVEKNQLEDYSSLFVTRRAKCITSNTTTNKNQCFFSVLQEIWASATD